MRKIRSCIEDPKHCRDFCARPAISRWLTEDHVSRFPGQAANGYEKTLFLKKLICFPMAR